MARDPKLGLTSFKSFDLLVHILLRSLAFLLFLHLDLLPILLVLPLLSFILTPLDLCRLVQQTLTDTFHVRVGLDHFCEVVGGTCKWEFVFRSEGTGFLSAVKGLFIAAMLGELE